MRVLARADQGNRFDPIAGDSVHEPGLRENADGDEGFAARGGRLRARSEDRADEDRGGQGDYAAAPWPRGGYVLFHRVNIARIIGECKSFAKSSADFFHGLGLRILRRNGQIYDEAGASRFDGEGLNPSVVSYNFV